MHVLVAKNYDAMSRAAADIVEHQIKAEPQALIRRSVCWRYSAVR